MGFLIAAALAQALRAGLKPVDAALIYTTLSFLIGLMSGFSLNLILWTALGAAIAVIYFHLLDQYEDTFAWWVILFVGGALLI